MELTCFSFLFECKCPQISLIYKIDTPLSQSSKDEPYFLLSKLSIILFSFKILRVLIASLIFYFYKMWTSQAIGVHRHEVNIYPTHLCPSPAWVEVQTLLFDKDMNTLHRGPVWMNQEFIGALMSEFHIDLLHNSFMYLAYFKAFISYISMLLLVYVCTCVGKQV